MHIIGLGIFLAYILAMLGVGYFFMKKNSDQESFCVGGRNIGSCHIGLSEVATDVGGGFSIGLGRPGFAMGISGSWTLFNVAFMAFELLFYCSKSCFLVKETLELHFLP
jgi:SSS family solute:Na+ symporter